MIDNLLTFLFTLIIVIFVILFYQFPIVSFWGVVFLGLVIVLYHFFDFFRTPKHIRTKLWLIETIKSLAQIVMYLILTLLMIMVIAFWKSVHTQDGLVNFQEVIRKHNAEIQKK
jgi:hypothetical protein